MPDRRKQVGGWFPNQQDKRDYEYGMIAGSPLLPSKVDLVTGNLKRFLHQGKAPSCVGYAIAHQLMIEESLSGIRTSTPSATYIYAMARKQHQSELQITGTFPRLAYKGIRSMGCPPDQFWENSDNPEWLKIMPNDVARRHAMGRSGLKFYRIYGADRAEQIRGALSEGHPVCMGGPIVQAMYDYSSFGDWQSQMDWADALSVNVGSHTYTDWRLTTTVDGPYVDGYDGTTTSGFNITNSELGHLFYTGLGNEGYLNTSGNPTGCGNNCLTNTGDFQNLQAGLYWSGTDSSDTPGIAWDFNMPYGKQSGSYKSSDLHAIAVRPGLTAVAPEPISSVLFIAGGTLLAGRRYWKKRKTA